MEWRARGWLHCLLQGIRVPQATLVGLPLQERRRQNHLSPPLRVACSFPRIANWRIAQPLLRGHRAPHQSIKWSLRGPLSKHRWIPLGAPHRGSLRTLGPFIHPLEEHWLFSGGPLGVAASSQGTARTGCSQADPLGGPIGTLGNSQ